MVRTRTSDNWDTEPGKMDVLNLRTEFYSSNKNGIPDLAPTEYVPTCLAAWNMPRHREHAAATGGAIHFFLDDYRFETVWSSPERLLPRAQTVGAALTPDFSVYRDIPRAAQIWNTYRSRWVGAYWQHHGIHVIPTAGWGAHDTYDFCFDGIPHRSVVAVSDLGMKNDITDIALFRDGIQELVDRTGPTLIISYGRLRYCDSLDLPEVLEYPTYWDRRRKQIQWENEGVPLAEDDPTALRTPEQPQAALWPRESLQPELPVPVQAAVAEEAVGAEAVAAAAQRVPVLAASRAAEVLHPAAAVVEGR